MNDFYDCFLVFVYFLGGFFGGVGECSGEVCVVYSGRFYVLYRKVYLSFEDIVVLIDYIYFFV